MAAPLTSGASLDNPLGIRLFMIGFGRCFLTLSAQPSLMLPNTRYPVFILWVSFEFISAVTASNIIGKIFLVFNLSVRFSMSQRLTSCIGSLSSSLSLGFSLQVRQAASTISLRICSFLYNILVWMSDTEKRKSTPQILNFYACFWLRTMFRHTHVINFGSSFPLFSAIAVRISITR